VSLAGVPKFISSWWSYQVFWWHAVGEERGRQVVWSPKIVLLSVNHSSRLFDKTVNRVSFFLYVSERRLSVSLSIQKSHTCAPGHSTRPTPTHLDTLPDQHLDTWTQYQTHNYTPGHIPDPHTSGHFTRPTLIHLDTVPDQHLYTWTQHQTHNYTPGHIPDPRTFGHCTRSTLIHLDTVPDPQLHTCTQYRTNTCTPGHSTSPTITHLGTSQTHTHLDTVQDPHLYTWTQYRAHHYTPGHSTGPTITHLDTVPDPHTSGHCTRSTPIHLDSVPDQNLNSLSWLVVSAHPENIKYFGKMKVLRIMLKFS